MGIRVEENICFESFKPIIPSFHYSNIPIGAKPISSNIIKNGKKMSTIMLLRHYRHKFADYLNHRVSLSLTLSLTHKCCEINTLVDAFGPYGFWHMTCLIIVRTGSISLIAGTSILQRRSPPGRRPYGPEAALYKIAKRFYVRTERECSVSKDNDVRRMYT